MNKNELIEFLQRQVGFLQGKLDEALASVSSLTLANEKLTATVDELRKDFNKYGPRSEEDFQEYKSRFWDWNWDIVIVRPLVKIKTEYGEISSETAAQRIYIFPYKTLLTNEDTPSF